MIRLLADENFNGRILRGIFREIPDADIVRVQDTEIFEADDPTVLAWAATQNRILLTHDIKTMPKYANERLVAGLPMPGVIAADDDLPFGKVIKVIKDILLVITASEPEEWADRVVFLPI